MQKPDMSLHCAALTFVPHTERANAFLAERYASLERDATLFDVLEILRDAIALRMLVRMQP